MKIKYKKIMCKKWSQGVNEPCGFRVVTQPVSAKQIRLRGAIGTINRVETRGNRGTD